MVAGGRHVRMSGLMSEAQRPASTDSALSAMASPHAAADEDISFVYVRVRASGTEPTRGADLA